MAVDETNFTLALGTESEVLERYLVATSEVDVSKKFTEVNKFIEINGRGGV